mgnify:CR=1 FL=1
MFDIADGRLETLPILVLYSFDVWHIDGDDAGCSCYCRLAARENDDDFPAVGRYRNLATQAAILAVCAIKEQPVVVNHEVVVRPVMNLCLTFDHRIIDGAPAAAYLARLKELLEQPYLILA